MVLFMLAFIAIACSGSSDPVTPDEASLTGNHNAAVRSGGSHLWGIWDVYADYENLTLEAVPNRGAAFTANVTQFVDGPPPNLIITIVGIDPLGEYTDITADIGIRHPFPGLDMYTGFDVIGAFMSTGASVYPGPSGYSCPDPEVDQMLLNADGYTRWFNGTEFEAAGNIQPLVGYRPGKLGSPGFFPTSQLNGYKYYADGLNKLGDAYDWLTINPTSRASFAPGSINYRRYEMRFPEAGGIKFQYAVIAHWEDPQNPAPVLDDFPPEANADEALVLDVVDNSNLYYVDETNYGGKVRLELTPWDWSASTSSVMEEYHIRMYSDAWMGAYEVDMTPTASDDYAYTYETNFPVETLVNSDPLEVWIEVEYPELDYTNEFGIINNADGPLTSFFNIGLPVSDDPEPQLELLLPNGGQMWAPGTAHYIKWEAVNITTPVMLQYSKDNFTSDIHTIVSDLDPDDGIYFWQIVPNDPSETVKARVATISDPFVYDDSDDYFTILDPSEPWIHVAMPIGGEEWQVGDWPWILWQSDHVVGNVTIEYSKDDFQSDINTIIADEVNDGSYKWPGIPNDVSDTVKVRITADDGTWNLSDDYFSIIPPGSPWIDVVVPNGGQSWVVGSDHDIQWNSFNVTGDVKLEYSTDNFSVDINLIDEDVPNTGVYTWTIPDDPSDTVLVRITSEDDPAVYDMSDELFSIITPATPWIEVLVPNGGEQWTVGTAHEILWDSGNLTGNVDIHYSKDNFVMDEHSIVIGTANDGSFMWNPIPNDPSTTVRIRVRSNDNPSMYFDLSDNNFTISGTGGGWARHWGWTNNDYSYGVCSDSGGNVFVSGSFEGTVDFDPGGEEDEHSPNGDVGADAFLSKFDSEGNFEWARTWGGIGGTSYRDTGYAVAADNFGNVYCCGYFYNTADLDGTNGVDEHTAVGTRDIFLVKYDGDGNYQWGHSLGNSNSSEYAYELGCDQFGDVYMAGEFTYTMDFDPDPNDTEERTPSPYYYEDIFLVKFDNNGDFVWVNTWGGNRYDEQVNGLCVDSSDNIIVAGYYESTIEVDFDPGPGEDMEGPTGNYNDAFLVKYDSSGTYQWGHTWGASEDDEAMGCGVDSSGNIYVAGTYKWNVDFDPGPDVEQPGYFWDDDSFLSKFDSSGNFQWVEIWGNVNGDDYVQYMTADDSGNVFIIYYLYSSGRYLCRFSSNGSQLWQHYMSVYGVYDMKNDCDGNLLFAGQFSGSYDFDPGPGTDNHYSHGQSDAFVWKLMPDGYY